MTGAPPVDDPARAWEPDEPGAAAPWDEARVAHLHRRAGFGATWGQLHRGAGRSRRPGRPLSGATMRRSIRWSPGVVLLPVALAAPAAAQAPDPEAARAAVAWEARGGPRRRVVDQVCLVPDLPTFLEAVASWDAGHFFPVLLEDAEFTFKFLRAFRPARVVRYPGPARPIPPGGNWEAAVAAVGRSWKLPGQDGTETPAGDAVPLGLGPTPPAVVVSAPDSPTLAAAVALAAGRFQPMIRWEPAPPAAGPVTAEQAEALARDLEARVSARIPAYDRLGDACDFLTLAGDYPYRYEARVAFQPGSAAFDDLVGRTGPDGTRWAFAGRLLGDPTAGVYRAMCSLFLQPASALLFNGYSEEDPPWSSYTMRTAAVRLGQLLPTEQRAGPRQASLEGWHRAFDPENRAGLVLINSSGHPAVFNLPGGEGRTADVPMTVPAAVLVIHSFSATDPADPQTLSGRWLANGAFVYFGAMNEPFLQSFRPPAQVADRIAAGWPLSAALRTSPQEAGPFGLPWRLVYLGDPLYRLEPEAARVPRVAGEAVSSWPSYRETPPPAADADDFTRLTWALKAAILDGRQGAGRTAPPALLHVLLSIRRERLAPNHRALFDPLLADVLFHARRLRDLRDRLARIPSAERTPALGRWLETARMIDLHRALAARAWPAAVAAWDELVRSGPPADSIARITGLVAALADSPARRQAWRARLRGALRDVRQTPGADTVAAELQRRFDEIPRP